MPTSVLLAVLAAAALLALAPALVRRYDATERLVAERAFSTARVLNRRRRRRSVPGRYPVNPSRVLVVTLRAARPSPDVVSGSAASGRSGTPGRPAPGRLEPGRVPSTRRAADAAVRAGRRVHDRRRMSVRRARRNTPATYRRRRALAALVTLNLVELVGVIVVGPGFWVGVAATGTLLLLFLVYLRNMALAEARRRRREARHAAWLAARQAEVRAAQERRLAARREAHKRLAAQREAVRRAIAGLDRSSAARGQQYSIRYGSETRRDTRAS